MNKILYLKEYILINKLGKIDDNLMFKDITTLKIGGKIPLVYYPSNISCFVEVMKKIEELNVKWVVIGLGSNVLCSDEEFAGVVINFKYLNISGYIVNESLYLFSQFKLSKLYYKFGPYYGFSRLSLIPGTIGGAVVSNAGLYGFSLSEIVEEMLVYENGIIRWIKNDGTIFGYRNSIFKNSNMIIIIVRLRLGRGAKDYDKWLDLKRKSQNVKGFNAGSTFKNPIGYSAWKLINDNASIRKIGECMISDEHSNFLVNSGNGKSSDMIKLANTIRNDVYNKTGVKLEFEWALINFD